MPTGFNLRYEIRARQNLPFEIHVQGPDCEKHAQGPECEVHMQGPECEVRTLTPGQPHPDFESGWHGLAYSPGRGVRATRTREQAVESGLSARGREPHGSAAADPCHPANGPFAECGCPASIIRRSAGPLSPRLGPGISCCSCFLQYQTIPPIVSD